MKCDVVGCFLVWVGFVGLRLLLGFFLCENKGLLLFAKVMCIACIGDYAAYIYLTINIGKICF